jgi:hypothetical protein
MVNKYFDDETFLIAAMARPIRTEGALRHGVLWCEISLNFAAYSLNDRQCKGKQDFLESDRRDKRLSLDFCLFGCDRPNHNKGGTGK